MIIIEINKEDIFIKKSFKNIDEVKEFLKTYNNYDITRIEVIVNS